MKAVNGKVISAICIAIVMLSLQTVLVPTAFAATETYLGRNHTHQVIYYNGHVAAHGFGVDISIYTPVQRGVTAFTKVAFAAELGSSWSSGSGRLLTYWYPYVGAMWVQVSGNSYYWPHTNAIVSNRGTGGECTDGWSLLLDLLLTVLPEILKLLRASPPETEWQTSAHWVKAIARDGGAYASGLLKSAAANFYSVFEQTGYQTLTVTAGCDIWVEWFRPMMDYGSKGQNYAGSYTLSAFQVTVNVGA